MKSVLLIVYDLNREQLDQLKESYYWQDETQDILDEDTICPEHIPDYIIFDHYKGVCFTKEDFMD